MKQEAGTIDRTRRDCEADGMMQGCAASPETRLAPVCPCLAAATALGTCGLQEDPQRNNGAGLRLVTRQPDVECMHGERIAQESIPDPLREIANGRKIDSDFVGKTLELRPFFACQHPTPIVPSVCLMPATRECPLCGGTMVLKRTQTPVHVPGQSKPSARTTSEWICPDCDYFEEAEEENS